MGRVYKRGKYYYVDVHDKIKRIRKRIGKSKKVAELVLKEMELQIERDEWGFGKKDGEIDDVIDSFLESAQFRVRASTLQRYQGIIANFRLYLEGQGGRIKKVSDLSPLLAEPTLFTYE